MRTMPCLTFASLLLVLTVLLCRFWTVQGAADSSLFQDLVTAGPTSYLVGMQQKGTPLSHTAQHHSSQPPGQARQALCMLAQNPPVHQDTASLLHTVHLCAAYKPLRRNDGLPLKTSRTCCWSGTTASSHLTRNRAVTAFCFVEFDVVLQVVLYV